MNRFIFLFSALSLFFFSSCLDNYEEDEVFVVDDSGHGNRKPEKEDPAEDEDPEEEEPGDEPGDEPTDNPDVENFVALSGVYAGNLSVPNSDPSALDVTVEATKDLNFNLALYDAIVDGLSLGDLIFEGIPASKDKATSNWTFDVKNRKVELMGGVIEADVDVEGTVTSDGKLTFKVSIVEPPITLDYEGTLKK